MVMSVWALNLCTVVSRLRRFGGVLKHDDGGSRLL